MQTGKTLEILKNIHEDNHDPEGKSMRLSPGVLCQSRTDRKGASKYAREMQKLHSSQDRARD